MTHDCTKIFLLAAVVAACSCSSPSVTEMRCEYLESPICIGTQTPRFTWNYSFTEDFVQDAFVLEISSEDGAFTWNSGEVVSDRMNFTCPELSMKPFTTYEWTLTAKSRDGRTCTGRSSFSTAMLSPKDWVATWISDGKPIDEQSAPVLRKSFPSSGKVASARLYVSAAAYADLSINGRAVSSTALNPGYTAYDKRNLFNTYDVSDYIREGENVILATLGNGFYNVISHVAVWDFDLAPWRGRARMIAELHITYDTGREVVIATDESWRYRYGSGPVLRNNIYAGDCIDASLSDDAAALEGYDDSEWVPAVAVSAPSPLLVSQYMETNDVDQEYIPVSIKSFGDTVHVCDFGVNMSGLTTFRLSGEPGTVVRVQHGEVLDSEGRLTVEHMNEHFRPKPGFAFQTDEFILGEGETLFAPQFSYHGFRYAEVVSSRPLSIKPEDVKARFIHTAMRPVSTFSSSEPEFDAIRTIFNRSYLSNAMGIPTDCPQREKNGWTADAHISAEIGTYNYDAANFYLKYIDDLVDTQKENGLVCDIAPTSGWGYGFGPVWDAAMFLIPQTVYDCYGDIRGIEKVVVPCEKYLSYLETTESPDGSIEYGLGDWCPYDTTTPAEFTSTCYYFILNKTLARFENLLGRDASKYEAKAEALKALVNSRFLDRERAVYSNGSQCALALALYAGIVPENMEEAVAASLSAAVSARDGYADFGMIGTKTVLRMLAKYGHADQAYEMVMKEDVPSFLSWIRKGYTSAAECWERKPGNGISYNHVFFGDVDAWMINDIAGINCDPEAPGFSHIIIRPHFIKGLSHAEASYDSVAGTIVSAWKRTPHGVRLHVEVPAGTTATVWLGEECRIVQSGKYNFKIWQ